MRVGAVNDVLRRDLASGRRHDACRRRRRLLDRRDWCERVHVKGWVAAGQVGEDPSDKSVRPSSSCRGENDATRSFSAVFLEERKRDRFVNYEAEPMKATRK